MWVGAGRRAVAFPGARASPPSRPRDARVGRRKSKKPRISSKESRSAGFRDERLVSAPGGSRCANQRTPDGALSAASPAGTTAVSAISPASAAVSAIAAVSTAATTTTAAAAPEATATAAAAAGPATTTTAAFTPLVSGVHAKRTTVQHLAVHCVRRRARFVVRRILDEAESTRPSRLAVDHDRRGDDLPVGAEGVLELLIHGAVREVPNVKTSTHCPSSFRTLRLHPRMSARCRAPISTTLHSGVAKTDGRTRRKLADRGLTTGSSYLSRPAYAASLGAARKIFVRRGISGRDAHTEWPRAASIGDAIWRFQQ